MTAPATNPLTYNAYIQAIGVLAVSITEETAGVYQFVEPGLQTLVPQALNYAELRIQRDIDFLQARSSNIYNLIAGNQIFAVPINDFLIVETAEVLQMNGSQVVNGFPLVPQSREFIQTCYGSLAQSGRPKYFAMAGDTFGNGADAGINLLLGPPPAIAWPLRINGVIRLPSLALQAAAGVADSVYTYISEFLPDLLLMASMIFVSAYQRNFSATSDDPAMPMNYEKQYQALRLGAITEENRKKFQASAWSAYSTPPAATPTR